MPLLSVLMCTRSGSSLRKRLGEPRGGRAGGGGAADDLQPNPDALPAHRPGGRPERKHLRGDAGLAQAELERALLAEDHMRIDVVQRAENRASRQISAPESRAQSLRKTTRGFRADGETARR